MARKTKELIDKNAKQVEFLDKCRNLAQSIMSGPIEFNKYKPLERAYQLYESMVSALQMHIQETKRDKKRKLPDS